MLSGQFYETIDAIVNGASDWFGSQTVGGETLFV
jgi:hypothetical protein